MADNIVHDVRKIYEHIENIAEYEPKKQQLDQLEKALQKVKRNPKGFDSLTAEANVRKGETVLHFAIRKLSFDRKGAGTDRKGAGTDRKGAGTEVVGLIVKYFGKLRYESRQNSKALRGQTPLHLAVTKGTSEILGLLLDQQDTEKTLLQKQADGTAFKKTVMMAELPLSVAALKNDQNMFQVLYTEGAKIDGVNSYGDNVCHSLVRYAFLYPDKLKSDVMKMLQFISEGTYVSSEKETCSKSEQSAYWEKPMNKIWVMKNDDGLSPLQLAAKFGQHEIFKFIMDRKGYCSQNDSDGLFDVKVYDITEIDAISFEDPDVLEDEKDADVENASKQEAHSSVESKNNFSILRQLLELDPGCAIEFITFPPVWRIIDAKWGAYQKYFWPWFILHVFFMSYLSWYSTFRSLQNTNVDGGFNVTLQPVFTNPLLGQPLSLAFGIVNILAGVVILIDAIVRLGLKRMPLKLSSLLNPYSNATFRFLFILFGLSLIGDFIFAAVPFRENVPKYENYLLMLAVFIGWLLMLFFLRAISTFSYFTVMIQYVLTGDLFRFAVVIMCELIGFTTVMFMALQGASEVDSEYNNYWRVLLSMFKLMVGLGDVGLLYQTRHPGLTIAILIGFIILTTLLMINSLIAMISRTSEDHCMGAARNIYWRLQRLSLVLYIESVLPKRLVFHHGSKRNTFWYKNRQKGTSKMNRYGLQIKSLLEADNNENTEEETSMTNVLYFIRHLKTEKISPSDNTTLENSTRYNSQPQIRHSNGLEASLTSRSTTSLGTSTMKSLPTMEIYNHDLCTNCSKISEVKSDNITIR